jgi:gamma-glutamylcyclotransferase
MKLYFAYGANLNQQSMKHRCPDATALKSFYLPNYRLIFSGVASIQPSPGDRVPGALWAITEKCERSLDCFEGYPNLYRKEFANINDMHMMFYRMNSEEPWPPSQGYLNTIAQGYRDFELPLGDLDLAVSGIQKEFQAEYFWLDGDSYQHIDNEIVS